MRPGRPPTPWFWDEYHRPGNTAWTSDAQIEATWRTYHRRMLTALGFPDADREVIQAVLDSQFAPDAWELYSDVAEGLLRAHAPAAVPDRGADAGESSRPRVAIVSDWGSNLPAVVEAVGLNEWVDLVLPSAAVGLAKPAPALYLLACRRAGVEPDAAAMIGDSYRADVLAARAAGLHAVLLDRDGVARDVDPSVPVATDLVTAVDLARGLLGIPSGDHVP